MSKLIVEMEMPVKEWNCLDCKAICADLMRGHYCGITKKTIDTLKNMRARPDWCPIVGELPEQHGRLVDADACSSVLRKLENEAKTSTEKLCYGYAARMFEEAFTIIAAERKDDE